MLTQLHRLRYEVYCHEMGYLLPENFKVPLEQDQYDSISTHFYAKSFDGHLIGTARLINPVIKDPHYAQYCAYSENELLPPSEEVAEVSRLVLPPEIRRGTRRQDFEIGTLSAENILLVEVCPAPPDDLLGAYHGASSFVLLGLFRAMYHHSLRTGVKHWAAGMSPLLARLIKKMGFEFEKKGPLNEAENIALYFASLAKMEDVLAIKNKKLLNWMQSGN